MKRHRHHQFLFLSFQVKVEYPLKQGLKLMIKHNDNNILNNVKVEYPLKQGLKPSTSEVDVDRSVC